MLRAIIKEGTKTFRIEENGNDFETIEGEEILNESTSIFDNLGDFYFESTLSREEVESIMINITPGDYVKVNGILFSVSNWSCKKWLLEICGNRNAIKIFYDDITSIVILKKRDIRK